MSGAALANWTYEIAPSTMFTLSAGPRYSQARDRIVPEIVFAVGRKTPTVMNYGFDYWRGESIMDGALAVRMLRRLADETPGQAPPPPDRLTPREREVLHLLALGLTNREIASKLAVSAGTVKIHVEHIIAKLGVSDRVQAAVCAVKSGLCAVA